MLSLADLNISDDLRLTLGRSAVHLKPSDAFDLAEALARKGMRCALAQEAVASLATPSSPARKAARA